MEDIVDIIRKDGRWGATEDLDKIYQMMDEMAHQPREPYVRQPGERGMYELQRKDGVEQSRSQTAVEDIPQV